MLYFESLVQTWLCTNVRLLLSRCWGFNECKISVEYLPSNQNVLDISSHLTFRVKLQTRNDYERTRARQDLIQVFEESFGRCYIICRLNVQSFKHIVIVVYMSVLKLWLI